MSGAAYSIPSRARAETVAAKTLPLLRRLGVADADVCVYVAADEVDAYRDALTGFDCHVREGAVGMRAQRWAIHADLALPRLTPVIQVDDDVADLVTPTDDGKAVRSITPTEWRRTLGHGFSLVRAGRAVCWGLYPVPNAYFMRPRWRSDLCYLGGGLFGYLHDPRAEWWRVELDDKEDFERSIRAYLAGGVARCDDVAWRTTGYAGAGGMQTDGQRTEARIRGSAEWLVGRYPGLATLNETKKSGHAEVRLRDRRRR